MANSLYFTSFSFYVILALIVGRLFSLINKFEIKDKYININQRKIKMSNTIFSILILILIFVASFRLVDFEIGGADAIGYIKHFLNGNYIPFSFHNILFLKGNEYLFYNILFWFGKLTTNYHILFMFIYGIIAYSFFSCFRKNTIPKTSTFFAMLIILTYLKGFNVIRNVFAIAIILFALEKLKKGKTIQYLILNFIAILIHYVTVVFLAGFLYYKFLGNKVIKNKSSLIINYIFMNILLFGTFSILQKYFLITGFSNYVDSAYSFLGYSFSFILAFLCIIFNEQLKTKLNENNSLIYYKFFVFYVSILPCAIVIGGASRLNLMFEIIRYILWTYIFNIIYEKCKNSNGKKLLLSFFVFSIVVFWIIFSIYKMQSRGYNIIPYILSWN